MLGTSSGVQNNQSTSETEQVQNMRETKTPFLRSLTSCAQEVCFPVGPSLVSMAQLAHSYTTDPLSGSALWHRPRAAHREMQSMPLLGNDVNLPMRCCHSLPLRIHVVQPLAMLFQVKTVANNQKLKQCYFLLQLMDLILRYLCISCTVIPTSASVTVTGYKILSNQNGLKLTI